MIVKSLAELIEEIEIIERARAELSTYWSFCKDNQEEIDRIEEVLGILHLKTMSIREEIVTWGLQ